MEGIINNIPNGWKVVRLIDIADPIRDTVGDRTLETLSISAGIGFVNQANKFGKELSGKQYIHYTVIRRGDFSFNKGNSRRYPYGCIYMLRDRDIAAVPNAFYSFRIEGQCADYFEELFKSGYLNSQLKRLINTGVRDDGLFNLYEDDFYNCTVLLPPLKEQKKIAEILMMQDKVIALKEILLEAKKKQKKWLMQNLLTRRIKIHNASDEWDEKGLDELVNFYDNMRMPVAKSLRVKGDTPYYGANGIQDYVKGFTHEGNFVLVAEDGASDLSNYPVIFTDGKIWVNNHAHVLQGKRNIMDTRYLSFVLALQNFHSKVVGATRAKLNGSTLKKTRLYIPLNIEEQIAIAFILSIAEVEIEILTRELETQKNLKKYLMQQLLTGKIRVKGEKE